jgi:hypothetical protein
MALEHCTQSRALRQNHRPNQLDSPTIHAGAIH